MARGDAEAAKKSAQDAVALAVQAGKEASEIDATIIEAAGYTLADVENMVTIRANENNATTLSQYMTALGDGIFVDKQDFLDAGGNEAVYDAYQTAYKEAKAEGEAADKAKVATNTLNTLLKTNADVDWDSEEIQQLIKDSGMGNLYWNALIAEAQETAQADADAKAAAADAQARADATDEVMLQLQSGTPLSKINTGLIASTGEDMTHWEAVERIILGQATVEETAKFYSVNAEDASIYWDNIKDITSFKDASTYAWQIAAQTGNEEFAQAILARWQNQYGTALG